ncbi:MAG: hypothetical protein ACRDH9_07280 [Actinomycetota bacterium]
MEDRAVFRWGSWAAIIGGIAALVVNFTHPRPESFADPIAEEIRIVGASDAWISIHVGILIASLLITFGLFALARSMKGGPAEGIARIALGSLLISTPIAIMTFLVDGYGMKAVTDSLATDPTQIGAATAVGHIGWALFMGTVMTFLGISPALFGWAAATDGRYPKWMGWTAVLFGIASVAIGITGIINGGTQALFIAFSISSGILTLWVIALGIMLGRRASEPVPIPEGKPTRTKAITR